MEVSGEELFVDLLFFNRELNSLVAVELKSGNIGSLSSFFARPVCINNLLEFLRKAQYAPRRSVGETECNGVSETPETHSTVRHAPPGLSCKAGIIAIFGW